MPLAIMYNNHGAWYNNGDLVHLCLIAILMHINKAERTEQVERETEQLSWKIDCP